MDTKLYQFGYQKSIQGNNLVAALATTPGVDRDGDIVEPLGVDLGNFKNNPVLLWSHDYYSLPIGKITNIHVSPEGIEFDAEFAVDANPFAKQVRDLFAGGVLNAFSIGFMPHERMGERITKCELLEISAVNVPANPEALNMRSYKSFLKTLEDNEKKLNKERHDEQMKALHDVIAAIHTATTSVQTLVKSVSDVHAKTDALMKRVSIPATKTVKTSKATIGLAMRKHILSNLQNH